MFINDDIGERLRWPQVLWLQQIMIKGSEGLSYFMNHICWAVLYCMNSKHLSRILWLFLRKYHSLSERLTEMIVKKDTDPSDLRTPPREDCHGVTWCSNNAPTTRSWCFLIGGGQSRSLLIGGQVTITWPGIRVLQIKDSHGTAP